MGRLRAAEISARRLAKICGWKLRSRGTPVRPRRREVGFTVPLMQKSGGAAFVSNPKVTQRHLLEANHAAGPRYLRRGGGAQPLGGLRKPAAAFSGGPEAHAKAGEPRNRLGAVVVSHRLAA